MAAKKGTSSPKARKATAEEWADAERIAERTLRSRWPGLRERAPEIARVAVDEAARVWSGKAKLSTLATTIAIRRFAALAKKETRAKQPAKPRVRRKPSRGEASALADVFDDFLGHVGVLLHDAPYGGHCGNIGALIRGQLGPYFTFLLEHHKVRPELRPTFRFPHDFDARIDAYAARIFGAEWIESDATIDAPLPGVQGKPPRDPYCAPAELGGDHEVAAYLSNMKRRHAGLIFEEKRERAIQAVLRHALAVAGYGGSVLNAVLGPVRLEKTRDLKRRSRKAVTAIKANRDAEREM